MAASDASAVRPALVLRAGAATECGSRPKNDDSYARSLRDDFFVLSDGIGGAPNGDVISRLACRAAVRAHDAGQDIAHAFRSAAGYAWQVAEDLDEEDGATLLIAERVGAALRLMWVGDSRAYLYRGGAISWLGATGRVVPRHFARDNALDKAIGAECEEVDPDGLEVTLAPGDLVVLCTDGVWGALGPHAMAGALWRGAALGDPFAVARDLCYQAVNSLDGGGDNATCWCIMAEEGGRPEGPLDYDDEATPVLPTTDVPHEGGGAGDRHAHEGSSGGSRRV